MIDILIAIEVVKWLASDLHYSSEGQNFYSLHLLADRVSDFGSTIDDLKEGYWLGCLDTTPPTEREIANLTIAAYDKVIDGKDCPIARLLAGFVNLGSVVDELKNDTSLNGGVHSIIDASANERILTHSSFAHRHARMFRKFRFNQSNDEPRRDYKPQGIVAESRKRMNKRKSKSVCSVLEKGDRIPEIVKQKMIDFFNSGKYSLSEIARYCGVSRKTVEQYLDKDPELKDIYETLWQERIDRVEQAQVELAESAPDQTGAGVIAAQKRVSLFLDIIVGKDILIRSFHRMH